MRTLALVSIVLLGGCTQYLGRQSQQMIPPTCKGESPLVDGGIMQCSIPQQAQAFVQVPQFIRGR